MQKVSKRRKLFQVRRKEGLRLFLRDWNEFATDTEFGIVLEYFCPKRMEKRNWTEKFFVQKCKREKGSKGVGLEIICPSKRGEVK